MKTWSIRTEVPAVVSLHLRINAKTEAEAKKLARLYINRSWNDSHKEKDWDGIMIYEEQPILEVESVNVKGAVIEAVCPDDIPVHFVDDSGKLQRAENYAEYRKIKEGEQK